ncbi:bifunctional bis(5'-adenosyl)-triphosphatase/adenylylsulfatase FHIT-like [Impatiens glandulifera]|uniref:bifunctional bis(5'-adenosyl)-triphosphatase/adenylylsulfatase FHIT-like n=1 Tax=Impatiens glandulifera TaxID=253017 RepID=UPI001FB05994|nr:bifunctional bis(5'-adenosyl)-triphosphatase/adenylylsulfatase FHIT-like [Impatiens glandulifera]
MEKVVKLLVPSLSCYYKSFPAIFHHFKFYSPITSISISISNAILASRIPDNRFRIAKASYSSNSSRSKMDLDFFAFGPHKIHKEEVFYTSDLSFVMVNLRPVVPGNVLVCPRRVVKRVPDLTNEEIIDLWLSAKKVGKMLEDYHKTTSLTFTIQDGPEAGQSVPHVHIHILPRKVGDFERNDDVYDAIDKEEKELKKKLDLDQERKDRSLDERTDEAGEYRKLLN